MSALAEMKKARRALARGERPYMAADAGLAPDMLSSLVFEPPLAAREDAPGHAALLDSLAAAIAAYLARQVIPHDALPDAATSVRYRVSIAGQPVFDAFAVSVKGVIGAMAQFGRRHDDSVRLAGLKIWLGICEHIAATNGRAAVLELDNRMDGPLYDPADGLWHLR